MLGSPIAHSRSPQLHRAAYRALGLAGWTYDRIECGADELPVLVGGFGPEWVGVSVTMPGKFAALAFADERTRRAERIGSANTLVRTATGWLADNTDVDGVSGALGSAGPVAGAAIVLGGSSDANITTGAATVDATLVGLLGVNAGTGDVNINANGVLLRNRNIHTIEFVVKYKSSLLFCLKKLSYVGQIFILCLQIQPLKKRVTPCLY